MGLLDAPGATPRTVSLLAGRGRPVAPTLVPLAVMSSPPTIALNKAVGASAVSSVASGGSGYVVNDTITLAGGTAVVATVLLVTAVSGGAVTTASIRTPGVYTTAPSNAVSQASTSGVGSGATFNLTYTGGSVSSVASGTSYGPTNSAYRFTGVGPGNIGGSGYYGNSTGNGTACLWEWNTDATAFDVRVIGNNMKFMLYVDGYRVADTMYSTDSSGSVYCFTVTNSTGVPCTYKLFAVNCAFGGVVVPSTSTVWLPSHGRRPIAWGLGDSYTYGTAGSGATVEAKSGFVQMCDLLGLEAVPDGIGGTGWNTAAPSDPVTRVQTKLGALTQTVDYVFLDLGYNDAGGNMTTLAASFDATVAAVQATTQAASARIIVFGPATPLGTTANLTTVKTTVSGRATVAGLSFVNVDNWVSSTNKSLYTGVDNTHPIAAGYAYLAGRRAQAVSALL